LLAAPFTLARRARRIAPAIVHRANSIDGHRRIANSRRMEPSQEKGDRA
jgi:hypothetical protein